VTPSQSPIAPPSPAGLRVLRRTYFPQHISKPFGAFHREIIAAASAPKTITAIAAPRAHGKTVNLAILKPIWHILRGDIHFFVAVAENEDLAKERTGSIAAELANNARLLMDFGPSLPTVWADEDYIVRGTCRVLALGYRQPIRGKTFGFYRPDYIVIDDFESHNATNIRIAREKKNYVREEAFGALPMEADRGVIIWLGNLTHADSALNLFKKDCEDDPPIPRSASFSAAPSSRTAPPSGLKPSPWKTSVSSNRPSVPSASSATI
jgi:hypothetical protein